MNPNTYSDHLSNLESRKIKPNFLKIGKNSDGVPVIVHAASRLQAMNAFKAATNQLGEKEVHIYRLKDGKFEYDAQSVAEASGGKKNADADTKGKQQVLYGLEQFVHTAAVAKDFSSETREELVRGFAKAFSEIGGSNSELVAIIDTIDSESSES